MKIILILIFLMISLNIIKAQDENSDTLATKDELAEVKGQVDGINETMLEMKNILDGLSKIKISGYIQAQYQNAEAMGIASFAGGNFPANSMNRFAVRRGRLKATYDNKLTQYVLQIDVTQSGVGIKDAYAMIKEPWLNSFSLTGGVFDRPFGFEISYSSSNRESPERSRLFQTLFPGERELGMKLEYATESGPLSFLNLKAGIFNGTGPTANENDNNKDFIGRLGVSLPFEDINLAVDFGASLYLGKVRSNSAEIFTSDKDKKDFVRDSNKTNIGIDVNRNYYGFDMQLYYDLPILGGFSLRGEYIFGDQPATKSSNSFYSTNEALYKRKFQGFYLMYIQNIGVDNQFVLKYDEFDPNIDVKGEDIGASGKKYLTASDIKYSTLGIGWIHHWDANVKFVAYYDIVNHEKVNAQTTDATLKGFVDRMKQNVFTFRIQYKF